MICCVLLPEQTVPCADTVLLQKMPVEEFSEHSSEHRAIFWARTSCRMERASYFGAEHSLPLLPPVSRGFLLGLLFDPEDGRDMSLRNAGLS
jgi:hypothetical protein